MTRSAMPAPGDRRGVPPDAQGSRFLAFTGQSHDPVARTVDCVLSVGARVKRWYGFEELSMAPGAVDLARVALGQVRLLDTHNQWEIGAVLGNLLSARIEGGSLIGPIRFADTPRGREAEGMVSRGELTGLSIGYLVKSWRLIEIDENDNEVWQAAEWELLEVSLVSVPADPNAGVRSAAPPPGASPKVSQEEDEMQTRSQGGANAPAVETPTPAPSAPETRTAPVASPTPPAPTADRATLLATTAPADANLVRMTADEAIDFAEDARTFGVDLAQARTWVNTMTPDGARAALMRAAADHQRGQAPLQPAMGGIRITTDERDTTRSAIAGALLHKYDARNELKPEAREYRGMSLMEIARDNLTRNGEKVRGLGKRELADVALRAHSTSDFPAVLSSVANRTLRAGYTQAPQTFKAWQRRASAPDFRNITRIQMGSAPSFLLVPEGGQFKMGSIGDAKEIYALATYGRIFSVTRQVLINDDVDAFTRIPALFGAAAARFESDAAYAPLIANPNMSDGNALFSVAHANLAGSGTDMTEDAVDAAEQAFGNQTGLGGEVLNLTPKFLIVPRKYKTKAKKLLSAVQSTTTSSVNVFANEFELIVESRLNRASGAAPWYMAADPNQVDTIEYAYLEGDDGVFLDERQGFEVDGMEFKARLDFGVKAIDHRGLYQNPGV